MITVVRTASVHDGKMTEAVTWAVNATRYLRDRLGTNTQLARNIGGPVFQLHWVSTYPSLADLERVMRQIETDEGYNSRVAEARQRGLFIATSIVDSLYESIPLGS
jgi:hypothetical protein